VLDRYGADLVAVLEALVGRPAVLVGHSLGGVVAWSVAQQRPDLVAAAFLEDPPLYLGEPEEHAANGAVPIFRTLLETAAGWHAEGAGVEGAAARLATGPMGESLADDALRSRAQALLQMDPGVLEAAIDGSALAPTDTAAPVAAPMLVLAADDAYGAAFAARHAERLARSHPAVEVLRLRGVGHSIHDDREHRADYVSQLVRFLER
jgi:pimeloyl-ACP methyl ester carboxylesterase